MSTISLFTLNATTLNQLQVAIKNVSDNVAHAQDPNYNRRDAVFNDQSGISVQIDIKRAVNTDLRNQLYDATSNISGTDETQRMFDNVAGLIGVTNNGTGFIQDKMAAMQSAWNAFQAAPESSAAEAQVISTSESFAAEVRRQFTAVNNFDSQEKANVQIDVTALNSKLTQLAAINLQAQDEYGTPGGVTPNTQDKQEALIKEISGYVAVTVFDKPDGSKSVYTKNGIPLVDKLANQFSWDPSNRNVFQTGGAAPVSYNGAGSLNAAFTPGSIGAKVQALDPTSPPTAATGPEVGIFQKYRSQLSAFVDLFTSTAATVAAGTTSPFDTQFISKSSDRTSDIILTTPAPTLPLAQGLGFFTTSNTPGNLNEASFAVNANLLNGSKTVNRQAAQPIINFFTSQNSNLGSATTPAGTTTVGGNSALGGLVLVTRTPQGIISGITQNFAANQARVKSLDVSQTTTQQDLSNRLSSRTGVSTDNELAQLQVLQNQYAATGRLMSTADTMFQTLLAIGR